MKHLAFAAIAIAVQTASAQLPSSLVKPAQTIAFPGKSLDQSPTLGQLAPNLAGKPLRLSDAISIALSSNPVLAQAGQNLEIAKGKVGEANSAFLPNIGLAPSEAFIHHIAKPAYGIQATLPIDISHLLSAAADQAHFQEIEARLDVNRVRNEVVYRVASSFLAALRAQALLKVETENLQNSLDREFDAKARFSVRAVGYLDVVRAETDVADARRNVIQAQASVKSTLSDLALAMGIDVNEPLTLNDAGATNEPPGIEPAVPEPMNSAIPPRPTGEGQKMATEAATEMNYGADFQGDVREALGTRPEILESEAGIDAAKKGVLIARRSELPTLLIQGGYYDLRTQSNSKVNEPQGFVGLSIPIFDGGLARSRVEEAKATVANAVTVKREEQDVVTLDVQKAYLGLVQAREQVTVADQALSAAKTAFDLAKVRYNAGVSSRAGISPLLEVSDAQAALTLAEQNQVNSLYDYNAARAQLDRSLGRYAYLSNGPGYAQPPVIRG